MTNKKKIGIITFWESFDNYGQQLQCWALQHYLRTKGYDAFLIRQYISPKRRKRGLKQLTQLIKDVTSTMLFATKLAYNPKLAKLFSFCIDKEASRRKFPLFRSENLVMSKIFDTPEELQANPPKADVYITGSDQVWNYIMPKESLENFFLQFGDPYAKRIAYAPSIGHPDFEEGIKDTIKSYLNSFSAISVREASAVEVLKNLGYEATLVSDPTMLISAEEYLQLTKDTDKRKWVFIYSLDYESKNDLPFDAIAQYAREKGLPIVVTTGSGHLPARELFEGVEYSYATVPQWISHIANAELVATSSFHGIVFSIIMHRNFVYIPFNGEKARRNNRILDLLKNLGLESQIYTAEKSISDYAVKQEMWDKVETKRTALIKQSTDFIQKAINGK